VQVVGCLTLYLIFLHGIKMKIDKLVRKIWECTYYTTQRQSELLERWNRPLWLAQQHPVDKSGTCEWGRQTSSVLTLYADWLWGSIGSAPGLGNMTDIYNNSDGHLDIEPKWPLFIPDYSLHGHSKVSTHIQTCIYICAEPVNCVILSLS